MNCKEGDYLDILSLNLYQFQNSVSIPDNNLNVLFIAEQCDYGYRYFDDILFDSFPKFISYIPYPKVGAKILPETEENIRERLELELGETQIVSDLELVGNNTMIMDITEHIRYLHKTYNLKKYIIEFISHIKKLVVHINKPVEKKNIIVYNLDTNILKSTQSWIELYCVAFILPIYNNIYDLGIDSIFINSVDYGKIVKIYENILEDKNSYIKIMSFIRKLVQPKVITGDFEYNVPDEDDIEEKKYSTTKISNATDNVIKMVKSKLPSKINLETLKARIQNKAIASPDMADMVITASDDNDVKKSLSVVKASLSTSGDPLTGTVDSNDQENFENDDSEEIATQSGMKEVYGADELHGSEINKSFTKNNIANELARRVNFHASMRNVLLISLKPILSDINYRLLDITFNFNGAKTTEIHKTMTDNINIKCMSPENTRVTLKFNIPKINEDRYVMSGGLKWFFPSILSTVPIFVIRPKEVQFRTNYSSIQFHYGIFNRIPNILCYVGGKKIPYSLLMTCFFGLEKLLKDYNINYVISEEKSRDKNIVSLPMQNDKFLSIERKSDNMSICIINGIILMFRKFKFSTITSMSENIQALVAFTGNARMEFVINQLRKYLLDAQTLSVLMARKMPMTYLDIFKYCAELAESGVMNDKLSIENTYLRSTDIMITAIEKGVHQGINIYKNKRPYDPTTLLGVDQNFVTKFFMSQGVLQMLQQQNPVEEVSAYAATRIVGPGGLPSNESIQIKDRGLRQSHFGSIDPTDTPEGDPGSRLYLSMGSVYSDKEKKFLKMDPNKNNPFVLGPASALTPFADKDDPARLNMASNQSRQTVPLMYSEKPLVMSGYESTIPSITSSTFVKKSRLNGTVKYIDRNVMIIQSDNNEIETIDLRPSELKSGSGMDAAISHTPIVKVGDKVTPNKIIAKNSFINDILTQGLNARCAYLTYGGHSFEDGIVISETLARRLTSTHYDTIEINYDDNDEIDVFPAIGQTINEGQIVVRVKKHIIGGESLSEDFEVYAPNPVSIADIEIYPNSMSKVKHILDQIESSYSESNNALKQFGQSPLFNRNEIIKNVGKFTDHGEALSYTKIIIKCIRSLQASIGDKLTNRVRPRWL
jgi:hypothetical protein